ncbi:MAG: oligosaccharide flippase family protein, partial [Nanoarchaeota archaeon]|nr:oligosaccharide flippase family protein [Nanoarchaeota archaeon]
APLSYLVRVLYSNNLDLADFGLIYSILAFLAFISMFSDFGLSESLVYYIPKYKLKNDWDSIRNMVFYSLIFQLISTIIIISFLFLFSSYLAANYFKYSSSELILKIFLFTYLGINLTASVKSLFVALQMNISYQFVDFLKYFMIVLFSSLVIFFNLSENLLYIFSLIWAFVHISLVFYYFIYLNFKLPILFDKFPNWNLSLFKKLFFYGFYLLIGNSIMVFLSQVDILMITYFLTLGSVGLYSNALSIQNILALIMTPITLFLIPMVSEYTESKNFKSILKILNLVYTFGLFIVLPFILVFILFSKELIIILFSEKFLDSNSVLILFLIFAIFHILFSYNISILRGLGLIKKRIKIYFFVLFINVMLNLILIPKYGIFGAGIATVISWFILFIGSFYYINLQVSFRLNYVSIFKIL